MGQHWLNGLYIALLYSHYTLAKSTFVDDVQDVLYQVSATNCLPSDYF